jgi:iron complex outermembrane recepter protein
VNAFVNNLADKRGVLTGGIGTTVPTAFYFIQPRTLGLSVSKSFNMN